MRASPGRSAGASGALPGTVGARATRPLRRPAPPAAGGARRAALLALPSLLALLHPAPAAGQAADPPRDTIAVIERGTSAVSGWDVAEAPFRLLTLPVFLAGRAAELMVGGEGYLIPNVLHALGQIQARGVHPTVYRQGSNSGLGGGLLLGVPSDRPGLWAHATGGATVKGYWSVGGRIGYGEEQPEPRARVAVRQGGPYTLQGYGFAAHRAEDEFYGTGNGAPEENRSDYDLDQVGFGAALSLRPRREMELRAFGGWTRDETGPGADDRLPDVDATFAPSEIPGFGVRERYVSVGISAGWRDGHPHTLERRSRWLEAAYVWNDALTEGAASFGHLTAHTGVELPFDHRRESVGLALRYENVRPSGAGEIAFYRLPSLGGSRALPSYRSERFRGEEAVLGRVEYRYRVWSEPRDALWFDTILFLHGGMVSDDLSREFRFERLRESYGVAFSFIGQRSELARVTLAWGDDGFRGRFTFGFGP